MRRTKSTFVQWHVKGSKLNYGAQLRTEGHAMELDAIVGRAIELAGGEIRLLPLAGSVPQPH